MAFSLIMKYGATLETTSASLFPLLTLSFISVSLYSIKPRVICTSFSASVAGFDDFLDTRHFHSFPFDFLNDLNDFTGPGTGVIVLSTRRKDTIHVIASTSKELSGD